jgi:nucleoside-diphosphate-sugar epimerase
LDEKLSEEINYRCFEPMVMAAKEQGVKRFIYASSSSVYGYSESPRVTEEHPLVPLTLYNKFKGLCEPLLFKHQSKDFVCVAIRPATICGYSPRQRLDLSVNILTNHAVNNNKITVFGGEQQRPNLHIQDMCDLYKLLLELPDEQIAGETFNAGYQNQSIMEIATIVKKVTQEEFTEKGEIPIVTTPSNDNRSYRITSDKIAAKLGFTPKRTIEDAVRDLCRAFRAGKLPNSMTDDRYYNVKVLKKIRAS